MFTPQEFVRNFNKKVEDIEDSPFLVYQEYGDLEGISMRIWGQDFLLWESEEEWCEDTIRNKVYGLLKDLRELCKLL